MPNLRLADLTAEIEANVRRALREDIGSGDITAQLIPAERLAKATIITRDAAVIAGTAWVDAVFLQLDPRVAVHWQVRDGERVKPNQVLFHLEGPARSLLTGERVILNLIGRLSGIATATAAVVRAVEGTGVAVKDTRKTTPGLRLLEKYAVACGGGVNHRSGLYDAVLIKDNHIGVAGSITAAVGRARSSLGRRFPVQVEVDTLEQLDEALECGVSSVLLDNMTPDQLRTAVKMVGHRCQTEASGGITLTNVRAIAETGVDSISLGWLTHSARSLDIGLDID